MYFAAAAGDIVKSRLGLVATAIGDVQGTVLDRTVDVHQKRWREAGRPYSLWYVGNDGWTLYLQALRSWEGCNGDKSDN